MVQLIFTRLVGVIVLTGILFISAQYGYLDAARSMAASARSSPKQIFIQNALNHDISGPYNGSHLQDLCAHTKWRPGLIFSCGRIYGGIGNVSLPRDDLMVRTEILLRSEILCSTVSALPLKQVVGCLSLADIYQDNNIDPQPSSSFHPSRPEAR